MVSLSFHPTVESVYELLRLGTDRNSFGFCLSGEKEFHNFVFSYHELFPSWMLQLGSVNKSSFLKHSSTLLVVAASAEGWRATKPFTYKDAWKATVKPTQHLGKVLIVWMSLTYVIWTRMSNSDWCLDDYCNFDIQVFF